jgi:hypothetical protein
VVILIDVIEFNRLAPELGMIMKDDKKNDSRQNTQEQNPFPFYQERGNHKLGPFNYEPILFTFP